MPVVVGVRFKRAGKIYFFDPGDFTLAPKDKVVVETARGIEYGEVVIGPREVSEDELVLPLKTVLRLGTEEDARQVEENLQKQNEAFKICLEKIHEHELPMKLIDVEYTFDNSRIIFYFTAEGRVDFRELVKSLASVFRTRIELRQIGVRDEAKMLGGIASCGRVLCCHAFLGDFEPVSIRMAKDQNLSLNPTKISGICGRLMCCLKYETEVYANQKEVQVIPPGLKEGWDSNNGIIPVLEENIETGMESAEETQVETVTQPELPVRLEEAKESPEEGTNKTGSTVTVENHLPQEGTGNPNSKPKDHPHPRFRTGKLGHQGRSRGNGPSVPNLSKDHARTPSRSADSLEQRGKSETRVNAPSTNGTNKRVDTRNNYSPRDNRRPRKNGSSRGNDLERVRDPIKVQNNEKLKNNGRKNKVNPQPYPRKSSVMPRPVEPQKTKTGNSEKGPTESHMPQSTGG